MRTIITIMLLLLYLNVGATDKYWGGTGNSNDASHWYTDSTFSTTTTVPTSSDNVYFTYAAGAVTCTLAANQPCKDWSSRGWRGTFVQSAGYWTFSGNVYSGSNCPCNFAATNTSGTTTFQSNGYTMSGVLNRSSAGGTLQLSDDLTMGAGYILMTLGTFNFNGKTVTTSRIGCNAGAGTCSLNMTNSSITITGNGGINFATNGSGLSVTTTGSVIHITAASTTTVFSGNGKTFNDVYFEGTNQGATISGSNTFNELRFNPSGSRTYKFTDGTTQTVSILTARPGGVTITLTGTSTAGWTLSKSSGTVITNHCAISYCTGTGGATWESYNGSLSSCTNWTNYTTGLYWNGIGTYDDDTKWFCDSAFTIVASRPNTSDNVYFTYSAGESSQCTLDVLTANANDLIMTGYRGSLLSNGAGKLNLWVYGDIRLSGTVTASLILNNSSGTKNFYPNGVTVGSTVSRYGTGGTTSLQGDLTCNALQCGGGTFLSNGYAISATTLASPNSSSTRQMNFTNSTVTLRGASTALVDYATYPTGITIVTTGTTFIITSSSSESLFAGNGFSWNNVFFQTTSGGAIFTGNNTFNELRFAPSSAATYKFTDGSTQTITTLTADGTPGNRITLTGTSTAGWTISKSSGITNVSFCNISYSTASGGVWRGGSNSTPGAGNSGWQFTNTNNFGVSF